MVRSALPKLASSYILHHSRWLCREKHYLVLGKAVPNDIDVEPRTLTIRYVEQA
jgi:hypothetical protein